MSELPNNVERHIVFWYPDYPSFEYQLLRYTYADREEIMMEVLQLSRGNLLMLSVLITERLDTRPRITPDDVVTQLSDALPKTVAQFVVEHFPHIVLSVKHQLLRFTNDDRETLMMEVLQKSKGSLWILTQLITQLLEPSAQLKDQPRRHHSQYGEYESDARFTELDIAIQDTFEEAYWEDARQLISGLQLDPIENRRLVRDSAGQMDKLRELIKRQASQLPYRQPSVSAVSPHKQIKLEETITIHFPDQKEAVKRLLGRYPDHEGVYNAIIETSGGNWDKLQSLLKSWQDTDKTPAETLLQKTTNVVKADIGADRLKASEGRLDQAIERFFSQRKAEVMEVLNRYHGKNPATVRARLVEQSGGQFSKLLDGLDQHLFPEPAPYRRLPPANGPVWLDWVHIGDSRDALMALTPAQAETMKTAYEARMADGDAAYKVAARSVIPSAIQELVAAHISSSADQEKILAAFERYSFDSSTHRDAVFRAILQQSHVPEKVLDMVLYQKLGLRTYAE